jgi:hypothetical protein
MKGFDATGRVFNFVNFFARFSRVFDNFLKIIVSFVQFRREFSEELRCCRPRI